MSGGRRVSERKEHWYKCGQCGNLQYAVVNDETPVPCVDCGWVHRDTKKHDLPTELKLDLTQYG